MNIKAYIQRAEGVLLDYRVAAGAFLIATVVASVQKYLVDAKGLEIYRIYTRAFHNLIAGKDLYTLVPGSDYFLYTPTAALLMGPFAVLPDASGSLLWNIVNAAALVAGVHLLPLMAKQKSAVLWIVFFEALTCLQNFQSNTLIAGLLVLAFVCFERRRPVSAAILICLAAYVKIYAIGFVVICLFYDRKWRFAGGMVMAFALAFLAPLLVVSQEHYEFLCRRWVWSLGLDTTSDLNAMGILRTWFHVDVGNAPVQALSLALLAVPLLRFSSYKTPCFRLWFFCSLLVWVVVFSHKAESPSYVIAMTGIALWAVTDKQCPALWALLGFALLFTSLSCTDLFPKFVRSGFFAPYAIKAAPCLLWWFVMEATLILPLFVKQGGTLTEEPPQTQETARDNTTPRE